MTLIFQERMNLKMKRMTTLFREEIVKQLCLYAILIFIGVALFSCENSSQPKPDAYLGLEYPVATYERATVEHISFDQNALSKIIKAKSDEYEITYPSMKAAIYLTYKPVQNNLHFLLEDAQKLTYNHTIKANEIIEQPYVNLHKKVYGMFYNVTGDAATNIQFYATDSTHHFVLGTLYFNVKPNFDSIYPATKYIEKDMIRMMESIEWTEK